MISNSLYFTLCSNNYLSFAFALGKSIITYIPNAKFIIGLVDKIDTEIDYSSFGNFTILPCFDLGYSEFDEMLLRYNIIEFNTAVKPFYFEYFFNSNPEIEHIYYIDPDIFFYQSPLELDKEWGTSEILLTPNLIELPVKTVTGELASLRHGINNLGFIGVKRSDNSVKFLSWWKERLRIYCKIDKCRGIFVDQKWIDLAPLFFEKIKSVKNLGWNMAWWNFSERELICDQNLIYVNSIKSPLIFFHFSGYKPGNQIFTERLINGEFETKEGSLLFLLHEDYKKILLDCGYEKLSKVRPQLKFFTPPNSPWNKVGMMLKSKIINLIYRFFKV